MFCLFYHSSLFHYSLSSCKASKKTCFAAPKSLRWKRAILQSETKEQSEKWLLSMSVAVASECQDKTCFFFFIFNLAVMNKLSILSKYFLLLSTTWIQFGRLYKCNVLTSATTIFPRPIIFPLIIIKFLYKGSSNSWS